MRKGERKKSEILRIAEELFYRNGYDDTTVEDILSAASLSKGGFYHHFSSKEELLDTLCRKKATDIFRTAQEKVTACIGTWTEKFNALFNSYGMWDQGNADFIELLISVQDKRSNLLFRDTLKKQLHSLMVPLLNEIVRNGAESGEFSTPFPEGTGTILLQLASCFSDSIAASLLGKEEMPDFARIMADLELYRYAVEQILGAPYGSICLYEMRPMTETLQALCEKYRRNKSL